MIKFKKLHPDAQVPVYGSQHAAGLDLSIIESVTIPAGKRATLKTGIAMAIPHGHVGLIWPRSKLGAKFGLQVNAGVIDSDYRGEIMVCIHNASEDEVELRKGDKCAQMLIQQICNAYPLTQVESLDETERGDEGINSSQLRLQ